MRTVPPRLDEWDGESLFIVFGTWVRGLGGMSRVSLDVVSDKGDGVGHGDDGGCTVSFRDVDDGIVVSTENGTKIFRCPPSHLHHPYVQDSCFCSHERLHLSIREGQGSDRRVSSRSTSSHRTVRSPLPPPTDTDTSTLQQLWTRRSVLLGHSLGSSTTNSPTEVSVRD